MWYKSFVPYPNRRDVTMSATQTTSELFQRLGGRIKTAVDAHKNDERKGGFAELPAFTTGVAKLTRVEFYNDEGVLRFRAIGKMVAPMYAEGGVPLVDLETSQFATITEGDADKGIADVLEVLGKMVGNTVLNQLIAAYPNKDTGYDLDKVVSAVQAKTTKDPIYFRCSNKFEENKSGKKDPKTGKPFPGRTWQRWQLAVPGYVPMTAAPSPTAPAPSTNGHHKPDPQTAFDAPNPAVSAKTVTNRVTQPEPIPLTGDSGAAEATDWTLVGGMADNGDQASVNLLFDAAKELGYDEDDLGEATSYGLIAGWVKSGVRKGGHSENNPVAGVISPMVGTNVKYLPPDVKDKTGQTRMKRVVACDITDVAGDGTMTLKSLADSSKVWAGIAWNDPHVDYPK